MPALFTMSFNRRTGIELLARAIVPTWLTCSCASGNPTTFSFVGFLIMNEAEERDAVSHGDVRLDWPGLR